MIIHWKIKCIGETQLLLVFLLANSAKCLTTEYSVMHADSNDVIIIEVSLVHVRKEEDNIIKINLNEPLKLLPCMCQ